MLIDSFNRQDFINEEVADAVGALIELEQQFIDRKAGNVLAGHLLSLSSTFREDQGPILKLIQQGSSLSSRTTKPRQTMVIAPRHERKPAKYDKQGNCKTCGGKTVSPTTVAEGLKPAEDKHKLAGAPTTLDGMKGVKTWRDVLSHFGSDVDAMQVFCKLNSVSLGQAKKPDAIAKKIFEKLLHEGLA